MNINLHALWLAVVLVVSFPSFACIASVAATVGDEDGGMMVSSSTHRHQLNLRRNNHHANVGTPPTTADTSSKSHNLRRLEDPARQLHEFIIITQLVSSSTYPSLPQLAHIITVVISVSLAVASFSKLLSSVLYGGY